MTEPKAEYMTESTELLPCPFCGGKDIDERGWLSGDGGAGPQCMNCGATAEPQWWNTRPEPDAPEATGSMCRRRWINCSEDDDTLRFMADSREDADRICEALNAQAFSTPKKEAPIEAELVDNLKAQLEECTFSFDGREKMRQAMDSFISSLHSRSGAPPIEGAFMDDLGSFVQYAFDNSDELMERFYPSLNYQEFDEFYMSKSLCRIQVTLKEGASISLVISTPEYTDWVEQSLEQSRA